MERLTRAVPAAFAGVASLWLAVSPLGAQTSRPPALTSVQARVTSGSITGTVVDDRGVALTGAMVSALGITLASTVTDRQGQFTISQLPPGEYLLRAHLSGFAASMGAMIRVGISPSVHRFHLRRVDLTPVAVGTSGTGEPPVKTRPILAAGLELPAGAATEPEAADGADHPHTETAWRLRHIKRGILKDAAPVVALTDTDEDALVPSESMFVRAIDSAASLATSIFTDFPFSGEVNFLTTGAVAPGALFSSTALPRGVAYLALAAPGSGGDWSIRAAMSEGDLSSWLVAGSFLSKPGGAHSYDFGLSYSTQEYLGGNPAALVAVTDGSRNVGELYAFDTWTIGRGVALDYGARYAHYDYLTDRSLLSPRLGVHIEPLPGVRISARASQRMVAPGEEEFLSTRTPGPWLPPERTFAPFGAPGAAEAFSVERARAYEISLEKDLGHAFTVEVGRFQQNVDNQLATLFGGEMPGGTRSVGHYAVGSVGSVDVGGWALGLATPATARIKASVEYTLARARWADQPDAIALAFAPAVARSGRESIHDLTSSFSADIRETATRVFLLYKVSTGFVGGDPTLDRPGLDGRFDVQVNQALPVTFAGTRWEVLVGLRNLFRDPAEAASVYDELLVVRPAKRLVGGFLVRF